MMGADGQPGDEVEEDEEIKESDPRHKDFKKKRAGHYGGEAEAMKLAQVRLECVLAWNVRVLIHVNTGFDGTGEPQ